MWFGDNILLFGVLKKWIKKYEIKFFSELYFDFIFMYQLVCKIKCFREKFVML